MLGKKDSISAYFFLYKDMVRSLQDGFPQYGQRITEEIQEDVAIRKNVSLTVNAEIKLCTVKCQLYICYL